MHNRPLVLSLTSLTALSVSSLARAQAQDDDGVRAERKAAAVAIDFSHFEIDDENPESNLPTADEAERAALKFGHMLVELDARLLAARERGDWAQAVKYDKALVRLGSDRATGYSGLCRDSEMMGDRDSALQACAVAVQKHGVTVDDFTRFVRLVLGRPNGVDPAELGDARNAIAHLKGEQTSRVTGYQLQCELSLKVGDDAGFEECTQKLSELAPEDPKSLTFAWSLAMKRGDRARALELVTRAKANEQMREAAAAMEKGIEQLARVEPRSSSLEERVNHPMVRWFVAVLVTLGCGIFVARRLTRQGSSV